MNAIASIYSKIDLKELGKTITQSKLFGCSSEYQGTMLALECKIRNCRPLELAERFDILHDKLSMKAQAMLAGFHAKGWKTWKLEKTPEKVSIEIESPSGRTSVETLTWDELKQDTTPYQPNKKAGITESTIIEMLAKGEQPPLKSKYATPRSRATMMWNRLVSEVVRMYEPEVVCGKYSPVEIADFTNKELPVGIVDETGQSTDEPTEVVEAQPSTVAEPNPVQEPAAKTNPEPEPLAEQSDSDPCTSEQRDAITNYYVTLKIPHEKQQEILKKRSASTLRNLTIGQASQLIANLETAATKMKAESNATAQEKFSEALTDPCGEVAVNEVRDAIKSAAQTGVPNIGGIIKSKLESSGLKQLADMSVSEARDMLDFVKRQEVEKIVELDLKGHKVLKGN